MAIRRRSLHQQRSLEDHIESYFRNPTPEKRRKLIIKIKQALMSVEQTRTSADTSRRLLNEVLEHLSEYSDTEVPEVITQQLEVVQPEPKTAAEPTGAFVKLQKAYDGNPELERQLKHLLEAIMRGNRSVKIDDAKAIMGIDDTTYVRRLLERLIKREYLKTSGKTKARKYDWTGKYPPWMTTPKELSEKPTPVKSETRTGPSDSEIASRILNSIKPGDFKDIILLEQELGISEAKVKNFATQLPELELKGARVYRKVDMLYECPNKAGRKYFSINFGTRLDGTQPARRGWERLNSKAKDYFTKLFERMCEHGVIQDGSKFKRLEGDVWEFKANNHKKRITCFMHGRVVFLLSVFKKKEDDTPPHEKDLAQTIMLETLARIQKAGYKHNPDDAFIKAEVVYAWRDDVGEKKVRIPKLVRRAIGINVGDSVKVIGPNGSMILTATLADRSEIGVHVAGIDGNDRVTLGVEIGDMVTLENPNLTRKADTWLFSYGSNNPDQLMQRLGHRVSGISAAYIKGYRLKFLGYSQRRRGGVAGLIKKRGAEACGYVCLVSEEDLEILDVAEGVAGGYYYRATLPVLRDAGEEFETVKAIVYMPGPRRLEASEHFCPSQEYLENLQKTIFTFWDHNECQEYLDEALDEVC